MECAACIQRQPDARGGAPHAAPEDFLVASLPHIHRIAAFVSRRYGLNHDEAADLNGLVYLKLVEDGYAILRKFRGESGVNTFLTSVVTNVARDYRVRCCGRWRPSAQAIRLGAVAVRLEMMIHHRGHTRAEALQRLRSTGETMLADRELTAMLASLPRREPLRPRPVRDDALARVWDDATADRQLLEAEVSSERASVFVWLRRCIADLPTEERQILHMRYWRSMSVADIARALQRDQKPLYRTLDRVLARLHGALVERGVNAQRCAALLEEGAV